jgi:hypothetical protein
MSRPGDDPDAVQCFLVEIPIRTTGRPDQDRAARALAAAESRSGGRDDGARILFMGAAEEEGRLLCLIAARGIGRVRGLFALAQLPIGRIRAVTPVGTAGERADGIESVSPWPRPRSVRGT